ncbi:hypothetical protein FZEAL_8498 [Fusarium zealandicum]|uniref:Alpha/beta hydrolase fold-3 domain-containing protein n=1 Tax=Fusarium zealandicum TaxID=1053134 RepID=A0A8H4UE85_9HYPO|nr:hypothetical protein FZEAL_8498 [Fusarium zealandicum]
MRGCPRLRVLCTSSIRLANVFVKPSRRPYSSKNHERVSVRCGSAGHVTIDLINIANQSSLSPLFIQFPPFPMSNGQPASLPKFLQDRPVASINYRWDSYDPGMTESLPLEGVWPMPIHDTLIAYNWLVDNLAPEGIQRRDIYVYGSYLGASLASSLALTETHPHLRFAVRGLVSYNGIYNWTMFFPDHPVNRPAKRAKSSGCIYRPAEGTYLHFLQEQLPIYFQSPTDMFDTFASPSLFFHNPGLRIPSSYNMSEEDAVAIKALTNPDATLLTPTKTPRKSRLVYPPRKSTLKIPETLLLYDTPAVALPSKGGRRRRRKPGGNSLETQAEELAEMMQRSVEKVELKERSQWDDDLGSLEDEKERRIKVREAGNESKMLEMGESGEQFVDEWLGERIRS